ncbi:GNAT family N-acetyltransferase [Corynebacterium kroppenstedtii]
MNSPHLVDTWEQPWPPERWKRDWQAKLSGTYSVPLILLLDGCECGYMEIYRPHRDEISHVYHSQPHDLSFHIAVGDVDKTGRGIFPPLFTELRNALLSGDPMCDLIVIEPDYRNKKIPHITLKTGWVDAGERQQRPDRRVRLLGYPTTDDATRRLVTIPHDHRR